MHEIAEAGPTLIRVLVFVGLIFVIGYLYFLPSIIASKRKAESFSGIFVLNLLAGATGFFWIVALLWACFGRTKQPPWPPLSQRVDPATFVRRAGKGTNK